MDFKKLITRYRQFGGIRLVREYAKLGALWPAVKAGVRCMVKGQSFKGIYPEVLKRVEPVLVAKYGHIVQEFKELNVQGHTDTTDIAEDASTSSATIWWCWLQGFEAAPPIVKACYNSLVRDEWFTAHGYEVKVIDNSNWREYVELPGYIVEKWEKGRIPAALFSDLLRLELLIKYGGTWIDATVLCTGFASPETLEALSYLNADLFVFQYTPKGTVTGISISNWFISACSNNEILLTLRDMLRAYWRDFDCTVDYYIFHLFFELIAREYPDKIVAMPYGSSIKSITLMHHLGDRFDLEKWNRFTSRICFHKLAYNVSEAIKQDKGNYYSEILRRYE